jgi:hypothetical protein
MLENEDIEALKAIFVTRHECDKRDHSNLEHFSNIEVQNAKIATKLSLILGILGAIGVAVAAAVVKIIFGV